MIEAQDLVKRYGSTVAVNDLSFSIRPGLASLAVGGPALTRVEAGRRRIGR